MLQKRQLQIILLLYKNRKSILSWQTLMENFSVGERTIRKDISILKDELINEEMRVVTVRGQGVTLEIIDKDKAEKFIRNVEKRIVTNAFLYNQDSRVQIIISKLLNTKGYIKSSDLSDALYISRSQMSKDIAKVKEILSQYDLTISSTPHYGMLINGLEINKRMCLMKEQIQNNEDLSLAGIIGESDSISKLYEIVTTILIDVHYVISDIALQNLILHLKISINRMKQGNSLSFQGYSDYYSSHDHQIASKILKKCSEVYKFEYSIDEVKYLSCSLHGKREYDQQDAISNKINEIVLEGLSDIKDIYNLDFTTNINLRIALGLHIVPFITRVYSGMQLENIMTLDIKQRYPLAFDLSTVFTRTIFKGYGMYLTDDEIAYISLHFIPYIEGNNLGDNGKKVLLITDKKRSENILLLQQLKKFFSDVDLIHTVTSVELVTIKRNEFDALVTVEKKISEENHDVIYVNYFLTDEDIQKVKMILAGFNHFWDILKYFSSKLFFIGKLSSKEDVIDTLYSMALDEDLASKELKSSLEKHEEFTSSYFGNGLAIPHPEIPCTDQTFIAVAVLKEPIDWNNHEVSLVFLVSIEKNNPKAYKIWYFLSLFISNSDFLGKLKECRNYNDFISTISDFYHEEK